MLKLNGFSEEKNIYFPSQEINRKVVDYILNNSVSNEEILFYHYKVER